MKIFTPEALTISNIILSFFICLHLACEFFHYIYFFLSDRKNKKQQNDIIKKLEEIIERKCLKDCDENCKCKGEGSFKDEKHDGRLSNKENGGSTGSK